MSKVYFIKASMDEGEKSISQKAQKLFKAGNFSQYFTKNDFTAVKVHVGEEGNNTHITAPCFKGLIEELISLETIPFVTDSSTLYVGNRTNAVNHSIVADRHGFNPKVLGVPFVAADGLLGTSEITVEINCPQNKEIYIGAEFDNCQSILSIAHFTGHLASGFGATIKTLGMGCASKKGKLKQHAALKLVIGDKCKLCGVCLKHCPGDAITLGKIKSHIDQDKCIGCAECMAFCRFNAVELSWGRETKVLQENIAEYALGVLKNKRQKAAFFNFVMSVTKDCDCFDMSNMRKIVDDIGILASSDPVAIDQAALDLVESKAGRKVPELIDNEELNPTWQIKHAESIGLGSSKYELVEIE